MSGPVLHYRIEDRGLIRPAIKTALRTGTPVVLSHRAFKLLTAESGHRPARALEFLAKHGAEADKPVLLNLEAEDGTSQTIALARGWSEERLLGYVAGLHEELEYEFGPIDSIGQPGEPKP